MKIATIVGARPQFIKAAPVSRQLRLTHTEVLVHTGQHYDDRMSQIFFDELGIPEPDYHLDVRSGGHGAQTGAMLERIEQTLQRECPDYVLVYGDTNSTLAGALAAAKLHIPVAHVEAGLRSFNRRMPEELNRILTDHLSSLLFCSSDTAVQNLGHEGIAKGVVVSGDVMADSLRYAAQRSRAVSDVLPRLSLQRGGYLLTTIHRAENTDDPTRLSAIVQALAACGETVVFPVHPRTRKVLTESYSPPSNIVMIEPVGYLDMVCLTENARVVLTDSGGLQKEAYWLGVPCVTLRDETEWVETVSTGWNTLAGAVTATILEAIRSASRLALHPVLYGDGNASARIAAALDDAATQEVAARP